MVEVSHTIFLIYIVEISKEDLTKLFSDMQSENNKGDIAYKVKVSVISIQRIKKGYPP